MRGATHLNMPSSGRRALTVTVLIGPPRRFPPSVSVVSAMTCRVYASLEACRVSHSWDTCTVPARRARRGQSTNSCSIDRRHGRNRVDYCVLSTHDSLSSSITARPRTSVDRTQPGTNVYTEYRNTRDLSAELKNAHAHTPTNTSCTNDLTCR